MKKIIAMLLALVMLLTLFSGCGAKTETAAEQAESATADTATSAAAQPEQETEPEASPEEAAVVPAAQEEPSEEPTEAEEPAGLPEETEEASEDSSGISLPSGTYNADGTYTSPKGLTYPLGDGSDEVSLFISTGFLDFGFDTMEDWPRVPDIREQTGINLQFHEVNYSAQSEQFNLMVASGDMDDLMRSAEMYSGGNAQAYEDEVIIDLVDLIPDNAPDYWYCVENSNQVTLDSMYTEGHIFQIQTITNAVYNDTGIYIRYDWLDELGIENPRTLEDFEAALYGFKEQMGAEFAFDVPSTGLAGDLSAAFGSSIYSIGSSSIGMYRNGDTVVSGLISDGFREYISWFNRLYKDGIFAAEFYASDLSEQERYTAMAQGKIGACNSTANGISALDKYCTGEVPVVGGMNYIENADGVYDFKAASTMTDKGYSVSTCAEDPGLVLRFLNYFFTEPGMRLTNYGIEGVSYTISESGRIVYTDLILESDDPGLVQFQQAFSDMPYYKDVFASSFQFNERQMNDLEIFAGAYGNFSDDHVIPSGADLNTEETASIANVVTDVTTYADEAVLRFLIGSEELNDETWSDYVAKCEAFGINEAIAVYQEAYDQYLRGERTSTATADAGGAPPDEGGPPPA